MTLYPPFPYHGSKRSVADEIWRRFGNPAHVVDPFCGSLAFLLQRPLHPSAAPPCETVNDADALLVNFWRALKHDPDEVAYWASDPVSEIDLTARHTWLRERACERVELMLEDPDWFDVKAAGWWGWGISQWIGGQWGSSTSRRRPSLGQPHGQGINRLVARGELQQTFRMLAHRLRAVRLLCGDWTRCVTKSVLWHRPGKTMTAVFLDPPYSHDVRNKHLYAKENAEVSTRVREWAIEHANHPRLRIALAGLEGEHDMPSDWYSFPWQACGATLRRVDGERFNREVIWFSPTCLGLSGSPIF